MKYKCDVVRDLMPLCADESAAEESRKVVLEHLTECRACENYYKDIIHEISVDQKERDETTAEYTAIARRYRKRNRRRRAAVSILVCAVLLLLLNYALGFRMTPLAAAERSGRLNRTSEVIGSYHWGDVEFFFYESDANYDTIASIRHLNGWKSDDLYFVWPKYPGDKDSIIVTSGLYFFRYDKGILILPVLTGDEEIARVTITAFGKTKSDDIETGTLSVFAFENDDVLLEDSVAGYAYDRNGDIRYELTYDETMGRWAWVS